MWASSRHGWPACWISIRLFACKPCGSAAGNRRGNRPDQGPLARTAERPHPARLDGESDWQLLRTARRQAPPFSPRLPPSEAGGVKREGFPTRSYANLIHHLDKRGGACAIYQSSAAKSVGTAIGSLALRRFKRRPIFLAFARPRVPGSGCTPSGPPTPSGGCTSELNDFDRFDDCRLANFADSNAFVGVATVRIGNSRGHRTTLTIENRERLDKNLSSHRKHSTLIGGARNRPR